VTLHVWGTDDGHLYVRFDCFDDEPHYHYNRRVEAGGEVVNNVVPFDVVAHGPMLPWALGCLRTRLPEMLMQAGGGEVAAQLDAERVARALDDVEVLAHKIQPAA
jgi:hypothetical protein